MLWLPVDGSFHTGSAGSSGDYPAVSCADGATDYVLFSWCVPADWVSISAVEIIFTQTIGFGAFRWSADTDYGAVGASHQTHSESHTATTTNVLAANITQSISLAAMSPYGSAADGDYCGLKYTRIGADSADTCFGAQIIFGAKVTYNANQ